MRATAFSILLLLPAFELLAGPIADFIQGAHQKAAPSQTAATESLELLVALASLETMNDRFGLPVGVLKKPEIGSRQPIYEVGLTTLRLFQPSVDPSATVSITDAHRVLYFVDAPNPTASVEVKQTESNGFWDTSKLGQPNYTKLVAETLDTLELSPAQTIIVEIPSLQLRFIGFARQVAGEPEELMLASLSPAPEFGIVQGVPRPAVEVLSSLVDEARKHDGQPT